MANSIITRIQIDGEQEYAQSLQNASKNLENFDKAQKIVTQSTSGLSTKQIELREQINSTAGILKSYEERGKTQSKIYQQLSIDLQKLISEYEKENVVIGKNVQEKKKLILQENNYKKVLEQVATGQITAREASKTLTQELIKLKLAGKDNTAQYIELKNVAGELRDTIGDASAEISQAGSDTRGLDKAIRAVTAITAGFSIAQGASALFGDENENLQKTLLKVNSAMLILNGLQQIQEELRKKDTIFIGLQTKAQALYNVVIGQSVGVMKALRLAFAGLGIGIIVAGVYLLVKAFQEWNKEANQARQVQKLLSETNKEATKNVSNEIGELTKLIAIAKNENLSKSDRLTAIKQINSNYPEYLSNINLENIGTSTTNDLIKQQIKLLVDREKIKILTAKLAEAELKKQRIIEGQELGAITKSRIAINKFFGFQKDATRIKNDAIVSDYKSTLNEIDNLNKALEQVFSEIGTSGASVFDATKNGVQIKAQNQNKVVLNELDKLKKELEKKKKELEDKVSFNVVKGLDSESGGVVKIRTEITGLEQQIQTIENIIANKKIEPLELQIKAYEGFEVELKKQIEEATKQFDDLFNLELLLGNDIADNPALQKQVDKIKELRAELDKLRKTYNSYFEEVKEQETQSNVPIIEITEQKIRLSKSEYEQKKKDAENFRNENLISEQEYNEELKKLAQQRLQTLQENTSKAQNIYSEVMNVVGQITDTISQATQQRTANEIAQLEEKKNKGLISERQYQKEKEKIEKKQALREWRIATSKAFLQIPMVILNALTSVPFPANIALAAIYGAIATAQAAIVAKNKPKFRFGGSVADVFRGSGYVKGKSHEQGGVNAELEGNEYVFRREAVAKYGVANLDKLNKGLLKPDIFNMPQINYSLLKQDSKVVDMSENFNRLQGKLGEKLEYIYQGIQQGNNERFNLNKQIINKLGKKGIAYV